jgi:hypothetical protein
LFLGLVLSPLLHGAEVTQRTVILSTNTRTQDSGLLDVLIPLFEKQTGYSVKTVSVGTGPRPGAYGEGRCRLVLVQAPIDRSINGLSAPDLSHARRRHQCLDRPFSPVSKCPDEALARIKLEDFIPGEVLEHIPIDRTTYWA